MTPQFGEWFTSSRSSGGANCVEVAFAEDYVAVGVRDSKNRAGGTLAIRPVDWSAFLGGVQEGQFNRH